MRRLRGVVGAWRRGEPAHAEWTAGDPWAAVEYKSGVEEGFPVAERPQMQPHARVSAAVPPRVAGIVLAGGEATRLGAAAALEHGGKAAVPYRGKTFLARVVESVAAEVERVVVVAATAQPVAAAGSIVVRDAEPGCGPLAGIRDGLVALAAAVPEASLAVVVSCDVPLLRREVVRRLVDTAAVSQAAWTVPVVHGHRQVLVSVLRTDLVPRIDAWLAAGRRDVRGLVDRIAREDPRGVRELAEAELRAVDPALESFLDVDTPEDLERLLGR
jgi:molybdopterin-guanine dinucleotide biosynthesis protein A